MSASKGNKKCVHTKGGNLNDNKTGTLTGP